MLTYIYIIIGVFWAAPIVVITAKVWWNISLWQNRNYVFHNVLKQSLNAALLQSETKFTLALKAVSVVLATTGLYYDQNVFSLIGVFVLHALWFNQALIFIPKGKREHNNAFKPTYRSVFTLNMIIITISTILAIIANTTFSGELFPDQANYNFAPLNLLAPIFNMNAGQTITSGWAFVYISAVVAGLLDLFSFILVGVFSYIALPLSMSMNRFTTRRALQILEKSPSLKIIVIAGDKGKTATSKILFKILSSLGPIARNETAANNEYDVASFIQTSVFPHTQYAIIEVNDHLNKDIDKIGQIISADMLIITSIDPNAAVHYGGEHNLLEAKYKLAQIIKPQGILLVNADDLMEKKLAKTTDFQEVFYSTKKTITLPASNNLTVDKYTTLNSEFGDEHSVIEINSLAHSYRFQVGYNARRLEHSTIGAIVAALSLNVKPATINNSLHNLSMDSYQLEYVDVFPDIKLIISDSRTTYHSLLHDIKKLDETEGGKTVLICEDLTINNKYTDSTYAKISTQIIKSVDILITFDKKLANILKKSEVEVTFVNNDSKAIDAVENVLDLNESILITSKVSSYVVKYLIDR